MKGEREKSDPAPSGPASRPPADTQREADPLYGINWAKTEMREGYATADAARILAIFSDTICDLSAGQPSFGGSEAKTAKLGRLQLLFSCFEVQLVPLVAEIKLFGTSAFAWGWQELRLRSKGDGLPSLKRTRFVELWQLEADGQWRIVFFIDNQDQAPAFVEQFVAGLQAQAPSA